MGRGIMLPLLMLTGGLMMITEMVIISAVALGELRTSHQPMPSRRLDIGRAHWQRVSLTSDPIIERGAASANGRWAVFDRVVFDNSDIFLVDHLTGQIRQLTHDSATDWLPVLSPDGTQVAFISWRDWNSEIYVIDAASGELHNISNHSSLDLMPAWSPDGSMLAFVSNRNGHADIYLADVDRGLIHSVTHSSAYDSNPQWAADGVSLTFQAYREGGWDDYLFTLDSHRPIIVASHMYPTCARPVTTPC